MGMRSEMSHEPRPRAEYYESRTDLYSQGDIFRDVPLAYPTPAAEIAIEDTDTPEETARTFLSGPLEYGLAMLISPTCSMRSQTAGRDYAHPVRTLVPLRPVTELTDMGILDRSKRNIAEKRDSLINYMWIPDNDTLGIPESLALLYMPVTLHHEMLDGLRVTQLAHDATCQLQKKLAWHATSVLLDRAEFDPPMD
jgi:hypothetical protein